MEVDLLWEPSSACSLLANYAYTDTADDGAAPGDRIARVPENSGRIAPRYLVLQGPAGAGGGNKMRQRLMGTGAGAARAAPARALAPGTQLVREWGGTSHHVLVEDKGRCSYKGQSFTSLSAVARHITGAHWSGPRFFGVRP